MSIFAALGFIALGAAISEMYHFRMWQKYLEGMRSGVSMRYWKMFAKEYGNPSVTASRDSSLYTREPMAGRGERRREQAPALRSKR